MATYSQTRTITNASITVTRTSNGSSTTNLVVPANSKATIRAFVSYSISVGPSTVTASIGGVVSITGGILGGSDSATIDQIVLGEGTYPVTVTISGSGGDNGTASVIGILEVFS